MECPICLTPYDSTTRPVVGSCGHSLCSSCAGNVDACPNCRKTRAFQSPPTNFLATELIEQSSALGARVEQQETLLQETTEKMLELSDDLTAQLEKHDVAAREVNDLKRERDDLQRDLESASDSVDRNIKLAEHYKNELQKAQREKKLAEEEVARLQQQIEYILRQEKEREELMEYDICEDKDDVPQPHKVVIPVPEPAYISEDTKKQLAIAAKKASAVSADMLIKANMNGKLLLRASQYHLEKNVMPVLSDLSNKVWEMVPAVWTKGDE